MAHRSVVKEQVSKSEVIHVDDIDDNDAKNKRSMNLNRRTEAAKQLEASVAGWFANKFLIQHPG